MTQSAPNGSVDNSKITLATLMGVLGICLAVLMASDAGDTLRYGAGSGLAVGILIAAVKLGAVMRRE